MSKIYSRRQWTKAQVNGTILPATILNATYNAMQRVSNILYDACLLVASEIEDYFNGEVILYSPLSRIAWKLCDVDGNILDFRLPDMSWKAIIITFPEFYVVWNFDFTWTFWWELVFPAFAITDLIIPGMEKMHYYINGVYAQGKDFQPQKNYKVSDALCDAALVAAISAVVYGLYKLGKNEISVKVTHAFVQSQWNKIDKLTSTEMKTQEVKTDTEEIKDKANKMTVKLDSTAAKVDEIAERLYTWITDPENTHTLEDCASKINVILGNTEGLESHTKNISKSIGLRFKL